MPASSIDGGSGFHYKQHKQALPGRQQALKHIVGLPTIFVQLGYYISTPLTDDYYFCLFVENSSIAIKTRSSERKPFPPVSSFKMFLKPLVLQLASVLN